MKTRTLGKNNPLEVSAIGQAGKGRGMKEDLGRRNFLTLSRASGPVTKIAG